MKYISLIFLCVLASGTFAQQITLEPIVTSPIVEVPEPGEKAMRYYNSGIAWWLVSIAIGILLPAAILFSGLSARIRDWAYGLSARGPLRLFWYLLAFSVITSLVDIPFAFYMEYVRQHAYELSNQTLGKWLQDTLISNAVAFPIMFGLLLILYALLRKFKDRWWLYFGLGSLPFIVAIVVLKPVFFDPMINDFHRMTDQQLEEKILSLADEAGIEGSRVFEVDKSEDTKAVNAYVTGFFGTKRIVLWDTIIDKLEQDELLFVMGHEMGHYAMGHMVKTLLFTCGFTIAILYLVHLSIGKIIQANQQRIGFNDLTDIASLPLILLMVGVFSQLASPIQLAWSRYLEHEADRFGLELTRDNDAAARAFVKLQSSNLGNPRPGTIIKVLRFTHPPIGERIDFLNIYKPWESGDPLVYEYLLKK
ncbi:MAG: M48 family metallopeptidase [bacterium]|nr:M48 family peptidase [Gammaproteobacteria bacterium]HIL98776.1 M48 family peptidase [Pseudomonadales bacterium]